MITAIIQARMGSTRYPNKVLEKVNGISLLEYQIFRIQKSKIIDKVIIATTENERDNVLEKFCNEKDILYFRGSEHDVLGRYYACASEFEAETIVRLTADCPLLDPEIIDSTVKLYIDNEVDYAANAVPLETSKYPDGSDVEVFSFKALERAFMECTDSHDREHVTFYFWKYDNDFKTIQLDNNYNWSDYRFTVDYLEDFEVVKFLIEEIENRKIRGTLSELIQILDSNPDIKNKNSMYYYGIGWEQ